MGRNPRWCEDGPMDLAAAGLRSRGHFPMGLGSRGLCSQSDSWRRWRRSRKLMVLGYVMVAWLGLPFDPASNQMSSHGLEVPTVQPTEGSRRQVDESALVASLPLKPGLGTAIHLHGFTHGATPCPQVSLSGLLAGGSALEGQVGWI